MMRAAATLVVFLLAGCSHSESPTAAAADLDQPFAPGDPLQLTYAPGFDRTPQWSTDADHVLYAFDRGRRADSILTGCVAELPVTGGSRGPELCETDPTLGRSRRAREIGREHV